MEEIKIAAEKLGISLEDATTKFNEIALAGGVEATSDVALALWRSYASQQLRNAKRPQQQQSGAGLAFGFFISLEEPRDNNAYNRRKALEEYKRDPYNAHQECYVAIAEPREDGNSYKITRVINGEIDTSTAVVLPEYAETLEDGSIIIALDNRKHFQSGAENKQYGKALRPVMQTKGLFVGKVGTDEEYKLYNFSYKNSDFAPNTFTWLHMPVMISDFVEDTLYGFTDKTLNGLSLNDDMDKEGDSYRDVSGIDMVATMTNLTAKNVTDLSLLDAKHIELRDSPANRRFVVTDGTVCNINMTPTGNGNRIMYLSDLNADFDYDNEGMTTCWMPSNIDINFGIGSNVIVVGRTSQREGDNGYDPATINVTGIYVTDSVGQPQTVEISEESMDWF
jgi:hypothetical protein